MSSKPTVPMIASVFADAADDGLISLNNKDIMCAGLNDQILAGCDGMDIDELDATEVVLVSLLLDDSSSMCGRVDAAIQGQQAMLKALEESKQKDSFLIGMWALNKNDPYHSYVKLEDAVKLDNSNYQPIGMTPLYDRWYEMLASNVAYAQQLRASGTMVRSIAIVITDGNENDSHRFNDLDCAKLAADLLASEQFVLAFVGAGDDDYFRYMAKKMGIPDGAVLVVGDSPSDMRKIFQIVSQSVIRASQAKIASGAVQNSFFDS